MTGEQRQSTSPHRNTEAASAGAVRRQGHLEVALMEGPDDSGRPLLEAQHHQQVVGVRDTQEVAQNDLPGLCLVGFIVTLESLSGGSDDRLLQPMSQHHHCLCLLLLGPLQCSLNVHFPNYSLRTTKVVPENARAVAAGLVPPEASESTVAAAPSYPVTCRNESHLYILASYHWVTTGLPVHTWLVPMVARTSTKIPSLRVVFSMFCKDKVPTASHTT
ncbi:hypothetical protein E2C01_017864 [Portunus trituberculatus]|uniref:Uncharacterized protein n=1 Tax=Portunus trituberculatus TaxID=210409 RepID=A0A5B7DUP2_PORTR|nr:hypothetical protein [Portunus trituberculatus]